MAIAQFGHFCEHASTSWLDPAATAAEREHSCERIAELQIRPMTVDVVEQIVAAVT